MLRARFISLGGAWLVMLLYMLRLKSLPVHQVRFIFLVFSHIPRHVFILFKSHIKNIHMVFSPMEKKTHFYSFAVSFLLVSSHILISVQKLRSVFLLFGLLFISSFIFNFFLYFLNYSCLYWVSLVFWCKPCFLLCNRNNW